MLQKNHKEILRYNASGKYRGFSEKKRENMEEIDIICMKKRNKKYEISEKLPCDQTIK